MEITCLSVPNPLSYLICAGIKDVDNRGFGTDYRGPVHIHSSGRQAIRGMPSFEDLPVPVIHEFNEMMSEVDALESRNRFVRFKDAGVQVELKDEDLQPDSVINEYSLLSEVYHHYRENARKPFFQVNAIIGRATLVDVVQDANSPWAEEGYHHWIFRDAVLFTKATTGIRTTRTGLWSYELGE